MPRSASFLNSWIIGFFQFSHHSCTSTCLLMFRWYLHHLKELPDCETKRSISCRYANSFSFFGEFWLQRLKWFGFLMTVLTCIWQSCLRLMLPTLNLYAPVHGITASLTWDGWEGYNKYLVGNISVTCMYVIIPCLIIIKHYNLRYHLICSVQSIYVLHPTFHLKATIFALQLFVDNVVSWKLFLFD